MRALLFIFAAFAALLPGCLSDPPIESEAAATEVQPAAHASAQAMLTPQMIASPAVLAVASAQAEAMAQVALDMPDGVLAERGPDPATDDMVLAIVIAVEDDPDPDLHPAPNRHTSTRHAIAMNASGTRPMAPIVRR